MSGRFYKALLLCLCLFSMSATADDGMDRFFFNGYDQDGYFVTIPAYAGNYIGLVVGSVPAALAAGAFHLFNAEPYYTREAAYCTLQGFSTGCGFLFGVPFKTVKLILWDAPKYVVSGLSVKPVALTETNVE